MRILLSSHREIQPSPAVIDIHKSVSEDFIYMLMHSVAVRLECLEIPLFKYQLTMGRDVCNKYVKQQPLSVVVCVGFGGGFMSPIPFTFGLCLLVLFKDCKQGFLCVFCFCMLLKSFL